MQSFRTVSALAALLISLAATACGGGEETDTDGAAGSGAGGDGTDGNASGGSSTGGSPSGGSDGSGGSGTTCLTDSNEPSGSSTVVWHDGDIADGYTMVFGDDGQLSPASLTVPVNLLFGIENPAGGNLRSVKVGCAGGQTMSGGITAGFIINAPGTYEIYDLAANGNQGALVGSVTVE